ncbi:MAG: hypothetical protein ACK4YQ_07945 [Phenylobacterium sp.]|uniref:hypothetical protein n=1 Tax=Phenylobacterium sp. TaxID=1871053 RepID=UPI003918F4A6
MRRIIALAGGVAAAFAGTVAGGLIKPEMGSLVGQIHAPRLETAAAGRRAETTEAEPEVDPFAADAPDYVVGTDWLPPSFDEASLQAEETEVDPMTVVTAAAPKPRSAPLLAAGKTAEPLRTAPAAPALTAEAPAPAAPLF